MTPRALCGLPGHPNTQFQNHCSMRTCSVGPAGMLRSAASGVQGTALQAELSLLVRKHSQKQFHLCPTATPWSRTTCLPLIPLTPHCSLTQPPLLAHGGLPKPQGQTLAGRSSPFQGSAHQLTLGRPSYRIRCFRWDNPAYQEEEKGRGEGKGHSPPWLLHAGRAASLQKGERGQVRESNSLGLHLF